MFSQSAIENLNYYVYFLKNPLDGSVFYVGKGKGNRIFAHVECALESDDSRDKLDVIRNILNEGFTPEHFVLRHGLSEREAFELEAGLIDFIGLSNLTNEQSGHDSGDFGIMTTDEVNALYNAEKFTTDEPVLLININRLFKRDMDTNAIYEATRSSWVLGPRRHKAKYAIATYRGLTREVYSIESWHPVNNRWEFIGKQAPEDIRKSMRYKSIADYMKKGAANPIKYINC